MCEITMNNYIAFELNVMDMLDKVKNLSLKDCLYISRNLHQSLECAIEDYIEDNKEKLGFNRNDYVYANDYYYH